MKGNYFLGGGRFELRDMDIRDPGPGQVLVRVRACGVCGTDVHIRHGEKGSADVHPPVILGHEFSGIVEKTGEGVPSLQLGDHVAIDPNIYCGTCRFCRSGKKQLCENLQAIGVTQDGGFAEFCLCPAGQCFLLDRDVPLHLGAMTEPLACCLHGIDRSGIREGDSVLVIGGGAIGLMMVQLARLAGASSVVLSEPIESRRRIGLQLGADTAFDPIHENPAEVIQEIAGAGGADVVIECAGNPAAARQAFELAGRGASIMLFSVPKPDAVHALTLMDVFQKELTIRGSFINPDTHLRAVRLIESGRIRIDPLITHRFKLAEVEDAIKMQMSSESIKVIVMP